MDLKCEKCSLHLGEMQKGRLRKGAVLLCGTCWGKAEAAVNMAEESLKNAPDFLQDLMRNFGKEPG